MLLHYFVCYRGQSVLLKLNWNPSIAVKKTDAIRPGLDWPMGLVFFFAFPSQTLVEPQAVLGFCIYTVFKPENSKIAFSKLACNVGRRMCLLLGYTGARLPPGFPVIHAWRAPAYTYIITGIQHCNSSVSWDRWCRSVPKLLGQSAFLREARGVPEEGV